MSRFIGQRFDRIVCLSAHTDKSGHQWGEFKCDCGNLCVRRIDQVRRRPKGGHSCGCKLAEYKASVGVKFLTHGMHDSPEYIAWRSMKNRCDLPTCKAYKNYGARGITYSSRWRDFTNFLADMGARPSPKHSLDRINNDGDYTPDNCRWATMKTQLNNKRTCRYITHNGETKTIAQWAHISGLTPACISRRVQYKWSMERVLNTPSLRPLKAAPSSPDACQPLPSQHGK